MVKELYRYFEPDAVSGFKLFFSYKKMPTYPKALRFDNINDTDMYVGARIKFLQSTKIPQNANDCPVQSECLHLCNSIACHKIWRKIWEYVK